MISTGYRDAKVMSVSQSGMVKSEVAVRTEKDSSASRNSVSLQVLVHRLNECILHFGAGGNYSESTYAILNDNFKVIQISGRSYPDSLDSTIIFGTN